LANKYTKQFLQEQKELGIKKANYYPKVTQHIQDIIEAVKILLKKGIAYKKNGSVYFDISKFKNYGRLSHTKLKQQITGTRVKTDKYNKEEAADFALWKESKKGEPYFKSPFGKGRPGWHIECSVMSQKYLGEQLDIHGGAKDLIFPHHENEIAQSESLSGKKPFVKYWLHSGLLTINGQKMSKSLGNYITIEEILEKEDPRIIRFFFATKHYRSNVDWNEKNIESAKKALGRIDNFLKQLKNYIKNYKIQTKNDKKIDLLIKNLEKDFIKAMEDDFNTPKVFASIFEFISTINPLLLGEKISKNQAKKIIKIFKGMDKVLNCLFPWKKEKDRIPQEIMKLIKQREEYRQKKDWQKADKIREKILKLGWQVEDTKYGPKVKRRL